MCFIRKKFKSSVAALCVICILSGIKGFALPEYYPGLVSATIVEIETLKNGLKEIIQDEIIVYNNCNKVLKNAEQYPLADSDETIQTIQKDTKVYVPVEFFKKHLGNKLSGDVNEEVIKGITYVPLEESAGLMGKKTVTVDGLTFITDKDDLSAVTNNKSNLDKIKRYITYIDLKNIKLTEDDFLQFEKMWRFTKIGNEEQDRSDPYVDAQVKSYEKQSRDIQNKITKDPSQPLYGEAFSGKSEQIARFYVNIRTMAIAYNLKSASTYHDKSLKEDMLYALEWMYNNMYGPKTMEEGVYDNWYYFQIDGPICLLESIMLIKNELTQKQIEKYLEPVNYFVPSTIKLAIGGQRATGANKVCITYVAMCAAILERNVEKYQAARDELSQVFEYVKRGDGFYTDGSFIQHGNVAYNGSYGVELMRYLTNLMLIVSNSKFELTDPIIQNQYNWVFDSFEPLIYKGSMMSTVMGRSVSRDVGENFYGARLLKSILKMTEYAKDETIKTRLKSMVKYYVNNNSYMGMDTMTLTEIDLLRKVMDDKTIPERQDYNINKTFYNMDRVVNQNDNYAFSLSMSSSRICNYEAMNLENMKGWYTGDGMTYLYVGNDTTQYDPKYWKFSNPYRRPGTTVDTQIRDEICLNSKPENDFAGSVSQDMNGVAAMFLDSYSYSGTGTCRDASWNKVPIPQHTCTLEAQKSWFIFDDEIVALGAGIVSTDNVTVETVVENRKLSGSEALSINGEAITYAPGSEDTRSNVQYANIEGTGGYFFPIGTQLKAKKTDTAPAFYEMWIDHGSNPSNATYSYVLLPTKTIDQTRAYSENPDIEIISNTNILQEVREKNLGVTGYVFWESAAADIIQADMPCIVMVTEKDGKLNVSVSDPTHKLSDGKLIINKENLAINSADKGLQIENAVGQTVVKIDFSTKPAGDTFNVEFNTMSSSSGYFDDLEQADWAKEYINSLCKQGIISASDDRMFHPLDKIKREEFLKLLIEGFSLTDNDAICTYDDVSNTEWYNNYIATAQKLNIVYGDENNNFGIGNYITRQDIAAMVYRLLNATGKNLINSQEKIIFKDEDQIDSYALEAIYKLQQASVISGMGDGFFEPKQNATRAEAAKIISKILKSVN